ncbi:uncharacterized protein LOC104662034 isoform X2 [Rhinopithecus roxellana]|uniref:uncharacterized protein LOC104662034 isoform X2 n=1 Tax=Rhinopithecus roxellana TaxID=61622 RepID=UPI0012374D11|nr:uncharacterized protein LOC104662034 isoform X2 [Rhinopithecus roxellana]
MGSHHRRSKQRAAGTASRRRQQRGARASWRPEAAGRERGAEEKTQRRKEGGDLNSTSRESSKAHHGMNVQVHRIKTHLRNTNGF